MCKPEINMSKLSYASPAGKYDDFERTWTIFLKNSSSSKTGIHINEAIG